MRTPDPGLELAHRLRLACEAHEPDIAEHLDRVSHYACLLGRWLKLPEENIRLLELATPLHDIGKIGVPTELLTKPERLTSEEMAVVQSHTVIGHRILDGSRSPILQHASRIALWHHESWDGSGYPHGLAGTAIPMEARIVAVADVYDALTSQRAYKPAWSFEATLAEMQRLRARKFDPEVLDRFLVGLNQSSTACV